MEARWQQLRSAFNEELEERVRELNQLLLRLERDVGSAVERVETFDALFREAHSLKGAARAIELGDVERLAHGLESALDAARRRGASPAHGWFDAAYRVVDAFGQLETESPPDVEAVLLGLRNEGEEAPVVPEATASGARPAASAEIDAKVASALASVTLATGVTDSEAWSGEGAVTEYSGAAQSGSSAESGVTVESQRWVAGDDAASGEVDLDCGVVGLDLRAPPGSEAALDSAAAAEPNSTRAPELVEASTPSRPGGSGSLADTGAPADAPAGVDAGPAPATTGTASAEAGTARREPAARPVADSVRVAVGKLDALLAQAGELSVTRGRVEQRLRELRSLEGELARWRREWRLARGNWVGLRREAADLASDGRRDGAGSAEVAALLGFVDAAEQRVQAVLGQVTALARRLRDDTAQLGLVAGAIEEEVLAVRLLPVASVLAPFERMVRDLARDNRKEVQLVLDGGETELDRRVLELLRDPLLHMLRNAVDHGIEAPTERVGLGKPRAGTIRLAAGQRGGAVEIVLEDDGAGLDPERIRKSVVAKGLLSEAQAAALDDRAAVELIFLPGFSTRQTVTATSGRGVGMDVVRENVERLNGQVSIRSELGRGTRFTLQVPLTLATTRVLVLEQSGQLFAVPAAAVERSARLQLRQLVSLEGSRAVRINGEPVPVVDLADILERPRSALGVIAGSSGLGGKGGAPIDPTSVWRPFVVLAQGDRRLAILADRLLGEGEIVVKSLSWPLRRVRNVSGAAVLSSGQIAIVLNPADVLKSGLRLAGTGAPLGLAPETKPARRKRLLVVDDSLTTRTLERSILEAAGYDTVVAADGVEALHVLRGDQIDLVVSDVDMPRLDGFGLTTEMRRDERLRQIPVVLVTSLDDRDHRERGVAAGADAYIVKGGFDQSQLLEAVGRLL